MNASPAFENMAQPERLARRGGNPFRRIRRRTANGLMWVLTYLAALVAIIPLVLVLYYVLAQGFKVLNPSFLTQVQKPAGEMGGGIRHALVGSFLMVGLASCIGLPVGILGGVYLAEFGNNKIGWITRFAADVLNGVPSIVVGIFVYAIAVRPFKHYSALAGGLALGIMMVPTIMRTTEELVRLVPMSMREASLALGATRWRTVTKVVLGAAKGGIVTGVLLAIARVAGETAPVLFTALGNQFYTSNVKEPMASLPVTIFTFATSPDDVWRSMAWGGALVLVALIFILSVLARYFTNGKYRAV